MNILRYSARWNFLKYHPKLKTQPIPVHKDVAIITIRFDREPWSDSVSFLCSIIIIIVDVVIGNS
jgi:hypothetical protein